MSIRTGKWRGVTAVGVLVLTTGLVAGQILETYRSAVDQDAGTRSQTTVTSVSEDDSDTWSFVSEYETGAAAFDGMKSFATEQAQESYVLLKNAGDTLPIAPNSSVSLLGVRSFAPVYGGSFGSITDASSVVAPADAFAERGLNVNPSLVATYETFFADKAWTVPMYGNGVVPEYAEVTSYDDPHEFTLDELAALNSDFRADYAEYGDAAVVVIGRPAGENGDGYHPGAEGRADGVETATGNILSISEDEQAIIDEAKENFETVIVLINSANPMELSSLVDDPGVDSILWIGLPGAYGFYSVADVLTGEVTPSGHLGNVLAKNTALEPAIANVGNIPWANVSDFAQQDAVNSYLVQAEGIYNGYRYHETRYADIVLGNGGADASAGTYANPDGTPATVDGTWDYANEVVFPFGYGLSYTTFEQSLGSVEVQGDRRAATVEITVTNTGDVAGKDAIQLYASVPYTDYDRQNGIEKSAIQLMDFEKTQLLEPGQSQTITMNVDLANLASYDAQAAQTFIVTPGEYYLAIGQDVHDALNNVLAAQGRSASDGMTTDGDASLSYEWTWEGEVDAATFSVSSTGVPITNQLSDGDSAMDYNAFEPGAITYLTRSDWDGTYPQTYSGFTANEEISRLLRNDMIALATGDDTSDIVFGDTTSDLMLTDLKGADFDDPRWQELVQKTTVNEFLNFAQDAFHNVAAIPSVGFAQRSGDDGPLGASSHFLGEGSFQGVPWEDASDYTDFSPRVGASPVNLAYTWNKELAYRNGEITLGESTLSLDIPIMIGPGMNIHRHAYNTRAFEYYSEDPILSGYIGSAVVQGAQSKGSLVNVKHLGFNDQEINRSGIAVFMTEQKAREMELRNFQQAIEGLGKPASFVGDETRDDTYVQKALGIMTSYNRIGAIAPSANTGVMVEILRNEWGFQGYNVTDFTGVTPKAAPKESILAGTTAFCGFGVDGIDYWSSDALSGDHAMLEAIQQNMHYTLYSLANSAALNGVNATTETVDVLTWWRATYYAVISIGVLAVAAGLTGYMVATVRSGRPGKEAH